MGGGQAQEGMRCFSNKLAALGLNRGNKSQLLSAVVASGNQQCREPYWIVASKCELVWPLPAFCADVAVTAVTVLLQPVGTCIRHTQQHTNQG